jgi:hypothetical protein
MAKRKVNAPPTKEQHLASQLKDLVEDLPVISLPPPSRLVSVGQEVRFGHIKYNKVEEVLFDGRIILLDQIATDTNYGNPIDSRQKMYAIWSEVFALVDDSQVESLFVGNPLGGFGYSQRDIYSLLHTMKHFGVDMNPDYQRGHVWDDNDKVRLIDSIMNGCDIGKFVFIHLPYKEGGPFYEVLDGKQRITAIIEFYESRFQYKGKYFHELSRLDQGEFLRVSVSYAEVRNPTREAKLRFFLSVNTTGRPVEESHIKHVKELLEQETGKRA